MALRTMTLPENAKARRLDRLGPLSLIGCLLLLVAYLVFYHGLEPMVGCKAVACLYFLCFVPGYLAQRYLFRLQGLPKFETLLSSLLLGVLLTPFVWYAFCRLGISAIFFPMVLAIGLAVACSAAWHRRKPPQGDNAESLVTPADAAILWLSLAMAVLWSYSMTVVEMQDGQVHVMPYVDHAFHATLIAELARGVPAQTVPFVAGAQQLAYHYMPHMWCDMIRRATGADLQSAYFFIALTFRYLFVSLAVYLALVPRFGRMAALTGVGFTLAVVGYVGHAGAAVMFSNSLLGYLHGNYPAWFGLTGVFLILYYVSRIDSDKPRAPLLLASILSVSLLWYKANFALTIAPAVAILSLFVLGKRRDYRWWVLCVGVQALLTGLRLWELSSADFSQTIIWQPVVFLVWWWDIMSVPSGWPTAVLNAIRQSIETLPSVFQWPMVLAGCLLHRFHVGLIAVFYLLARFA